jgi:hypothetical protein
MQCDICSGHMAEVLGEAHLCCEQCGELQERDNTSPDVFMNQESEFYIDDVLTNIPRGK